MSWGKEYHRHFLTLLLSSRYRLAEQKTIGAMTIQTAISQLRAALDGAIVGQTRLLDRPVVTLLAGGHVLVEGLPGLAKTTAVKSLANAIHASFHASFQRVQFTPDLLPGDLTGTDIYNCNEGSFDFARAAVS